MLRVLFVAEDAGSVAAMAPVIKTLGGVVLALNKSADAFKGHNIEVGVIGDIKNRFDTMKPNVVFTGIGSPLDHVKGPGELPYLYEALGRGIRTMVFEDFPGAHVRLNGFRPHVLFVLDEYAARLAREDNAAEHVVIVGHASINTSPFKTAVSAWIHSIRADHGPVNVLGSGRTLYDFTFAVACMEQTEGCLIPLFHPKIRDKPLPSGELYGDRWRAMLAPLGDRVVMPPEGFGSEAIVAAANTFMSGFSLMLYHAAYHSVRTVSFQTPEVLASLYAQHRQTKVPAVELGVAHAVSEPCDLGALPRLMVGRDRLIPFDPSTIFTALHHYF